MANSRFLRIAELFVVAFILGLAGLVGFLLPSEMRPYLPALRWIDGSLTVLFGVLSWELFQLAVPARYFYIKKWRVLRVLCVPQIWAFLVAVFAICLGGIRDQWPYFDELYAVCF